MVFFFDFRTFKDGFRALCDIQRYIRGQIELFVGIGVVLHLTQNLGLLFLVLAQQAVIHFIRNTSVELIDVHFPYTLIVFAVLGFELFHTRSIKAVFVLAYLLQAVRYFGYTLVREL